MKKSDITKKLAQAAQAALHKKDAITHKRRQFLGMVAKSGISASLLRATPLAAGLMASRFAEATDTETKRVIFSYVPNSSPPGTWMPSDIFTMNRCTTHYKTVAPYCNFSFIDVGGGGLGGTHYVLGGGASKTTFDIQLAEVLGVATPFTHINLGVETSDFRDFLSRKNYVPLVPLYAPQDAYKYIFGGAATSTNTFTKQKLALDANLAGLNAIKSQLSAVEKVQLEHHADAISQLQNQLEQMQLSSCNRPVLPSSTDAINDIAKTWRLQMDIAVAALQCGLTNVASIQFSSNFAEWIYNGSFTMSQYSAAVGRPPKDSIEIMDYLGKNSVYLLERLLNTDDHNGKKLIDSTVFVQVTGFGNMADKVTSGAPFIVASKIPAFHAGKVGLKSTNVTLFNDIAKGLGINTLSDFNSTASSGILV